MKKRLILFIAIYLFIGMSGHSSIYGFWCDGKLISIGITKYEVLAKCGEPNYKDFRFEKRIKRDFYRDLFLSGELYRFRESELYREPFLVEEEVLIEEWTYNPGPWGKSSQWKTSSKSASVLLI